MSGIMNQLISAWWDSKTVQEQADLESSFAIVASGLSFVPALILVSL